MGTEIERKFLVLSDAWRLRVASACRIRQGYLCADSERTVRVRLAGERAWLTIKGRGDGSSRAEFEYPIPVADALELLDRHCLRPQIDKTRHDVPHGPWTIEVDVFHGENEGLVLAEIELDARDEQLDLPEWLGIEVTGDPRYYNARLVRHPYSKWCHELTS